MDFFVWPFIAFLLPLPILVWFVSAHMPIKMARAKADSLRVPFFHRIVDMGHTYRPPAQKARFFLMALAWLCLVLAGMRPIKYDDSLPSWHEARNIMLTIDLSTSMMKKDFDLNGRSVSRINIVKNVVRDFIAKRTGDRLGMVVFGTTAHVLAPLSQDMKTLDELFADVNLGIAGEQTAIGDALAVAVKNTANIPEGKKIIILLSDGYSNAGVISVKQAIDLAKKQKIAVYTIGIGSTNTPKEGLIDKMFGGTTYTWDEQTLRTIAAETGGQYFRAQSTRDLVSVYRKIDRIETTKVDSPLSRPKRELFYYPLGLGLLLWFCANYKRRHK
ncbi:MAG: VWA domain-containing protein [Pseudomonadota bacterium]|nr:VWA domain-containing protein [Pseudomonadota bacterium]